MTSIIKNSLNIALSVIVMFFTGAVIIKSYLPEHEKTKGYIEEFNCQADKRRVGIYSYQIRLDNDASFRNRLDVACEAVSKLKIGDYIEVESSGHIFVQVKHDGVELFNKNLLNVKREGVNIVFILLFILASCDFSYRMYHLKKNRHHQT
jgi:hypothetical protein